MFCYLFAFMFSFHCALTFHYESRVLTFPLTPPLTKGDLVLLCRISRATKNGLLFCYCFPFIVLRTPSVVTAPRIKG